MSSISSFIALTTYPRAVTNKVKKTSHFFVKTYDGPSVKEKINLNFFSLPFFVERK